MKLSKIEIFGFKSFRDKFSLSFDCPLVGVVGPNGCGKSNIVDAIRWVLGETHAKQLRGGVQEDLIFNGAEGAKAMGMAEVSVSFLNEAKPVQSEISNNPFAGFLAATEIEFTRRLYRSGESEYFINKTPCRLKDMTDLFRIVGLGARGLSIVQQGTIGELISKKPVERRELIEEAAGISGFRKRIEEAGRKLDRTTENLQNLETVISEVETQVRYLNRQAKKAERKRVLQEEHSASDQELFDKRTSFLRFKYLSSSQEVSSFDRDLLQYSAKQSELKSNEQTLRNKLEAINAEILEEKEIRQGVINEQQSLRRELDSLVAKKSEFELKYARLEEGVSAKEDKLSGLVKRSALLEEQAVKVSENISLLESQVSELAAEELAAGDAYNSLVETNKQKLDQSVMSHNESSSDAEQLEVKRSLLSAEIETKTKEISAAKAAIVSQRKVINDHRSVLGNIEVSIAKKESSLDSTKSFLQRKLAEHKKELPAGANEKILVQGISCSAELRSAVSAVLGEKTGFLVSEKPEALLNLKPPAAGTGVIAQDLEAPDSPQFVKGQPLIALLEVEPWAKNLAAHFLGSVALVDSFDDAQQAVAAGGVIAVTKEGVVFTSWGWFVPGREEIEFELKDKISDLEAGIAQLDSDKKTQEDLMSELTRALEASEQEISALDESVRAIQSEREKILSTLQEESRRRQELLKDERRLREKLSFEERELQVALGQAKSARAICEGKLESERSKLAGAQTEVENTLVLCESTKLEIVDDQNRLVQFREERDEQLATLSQEMSDSSTATLLKEVEGKLDLSEETISKLDQQRTSILNSLSDCSESLGELNSLIRNKSDQKSKLELSREKFLVELRYVHEERSIEWRDEHVEEPGQEFDEAEIQELATRCAELKGKIERIGEVSFDSVQEFEAQNARLQDLITQREDLDLAKNKLAETIADLKEISRNRFREAFDFVSKKYEELIPVLFGGGSGSMLLIDSEDPLECGVELTVRPPGKKIRSLDLLSGGEKALSATAVILSIFLFKPSPVCVLDEVDAPLDDANLERFLSVIRDISDRTQFLIVTHNKQSMTAVNRLVGITMEEKGVSKAVHLDLALAEKEIERFIAN